MDTITYPSQRAGALRLDERSFWGQWQSVARTRTLPSLLRMLKDTGRWDMWDLVKSGQHDSLYAMAGEWGHLFWESDCAKWLEGACYFLLSHRDPDLLAQVEILVTAIISAQQPSGYLNVNFTVTSPGRAWTNTRDMHEMYNAGHLFEASVAYLQLTKNPRFTDAMLRFVRQISSEFGTEDGKKRGYPGHPEIELALLRLYNATKETICLDLARYFLSERGANQGQFYRDEQAKRGVDPRIIPGSWPSQGCEWYQQAHEPIIEQQSVQGHAVRVGYLLTGLADLCVHGVATPAQTTALWRLWKNMIGKKASITGGIGVVSQWEGFERKDYVLPNAADEGGPYNETCAGISLLMLADRLQALLVKGDTQDGSLRSLMDLAERVLYNSSVTTGMSLSGDFFTYENRLASSPGDPCKRWEYFECSCCPPNVLRTLAILQGYFWSPSDSGEVIWVHHYFSGHLSHRTVSLRMTTDYPHSGTIHLSITSGACKLRIPSWSTFQPPKGVSVEGGYALFVKGEWTIDLGVQPRLIWSHPYIGKSTLALAYGPLIYCVEDLDNQWERDAETYGHFRDLTIAPSILRNVQVRRYTYQGTVGAAAGKDHEIIQLFAPQAGRRLVVSDPSQRPLHELTLPEYDSARPELSEHLLDMTFVPYYYRANRIGSKGGMMRVNLLNRASWWDNEEGMDIDPGEQNGRRDNNVRLLLRRRLQ